MRLRRRPPAHSQRGRPLVEVDYIRSSSGPVPVAYLVDGASTDDGKYVLNWLRAVQSSGPHVGAPTKRNP